MGHEKSIWHGRTASLGVAIGGTRVRRIRRNAGRTALRVSLVAALAGAILTSPALAATKTTRKATATTVKATPTTVKATVTSAAPAAKKSLGSASLQLLWVKNAQFGGSYLAKSKGHYEKYGMEVDLLAGGPNTNVAAVMVQGKALVGIMSGPAIATANAQGAGLVVIGAGFQEGTGAIMSSALKPLKTPADLKGMRVGVGASSRPGFRGFLTYNNMTESDVKIVAIQSDPGPLINGEVDAYYGVVYNEPITLKMRGFDPYVMKMNDFGMAQYNELYVVRSSSLKNAKEREQIVALMRGEIDGWSQYIRDPQAAVDLAVKVYGADLALDPVQQLASAKRIVDITQSQDTKANGLFWMTSNGIAKTIDSLKATGVDVDPSLFDLSVLKEIYTK